MGAWVLLTRVDWNHLMDKHSFFVAGCAHALIGLLGLAWFLFPASALGGAPDKTQIFASGFESEDSTSKVEQLPPPNSTLTADALPQIGLRLLNNEIDPAEWRLFIDGKEFTHNAIASGVSILYVPQEPLTEGSHIVQVRYGGAEQSWQFSTTTPPWVEELSPNNQNYSSAAQPTIRARYSDVGSGIDTSSVRIKLFGGQYGEGTDLTHLANIGETELDLELSEPLRDDRYFVELRLEDRAGNGALGHTSGQFQVGGAPQIVVVSPEGADEAVLPHDTEPLIRANFTSGAYPLMGYNLGVDGDSSVDADLQENPDGSYTVSYRIASPRLPARYCFSLEVWNTASLRDSEVRCFEIDSDHQNEWEILSPAPDSVFANGPIEVRVKASDRSGPVDEVWIADEYAFVKRDRSSKPTEYLYHFNDEVELRPGENLIPVRVRFRNGEVEERQLRVHLMETPSVIIDSPSDWQSFGPMGVGGGMVPGGARDLTGSVQRPVRVEGRTSISVERVEINQQLATVSTDGLSFWFDTFFLHEGSNLITATATDAHGRSGSASITAYVDQTAPLLTVESPTPEMITSLRHIDVRGIVNDAVQAQVETVSPRVRVRNLTSGAEVEAEVGGLGYLARDVPLEVGLNRLEVTARDQHDNARSHNVEIVRIMAGSGRLIALSGNRQHGLAGGLLSQPLVIQAFDAEGHAIAGLPVHVDIVRGSGSIHEHEGPDVVDGVNPPRNRVVVSDVNGLVSVWLHLGTDARPGSDAVRFWSSDLAEEAVFTATAEAGVPHSVHLYGGAGAQYMATGSTPVEAVMAQVLDVRRNPVPGTLVEFRIAEGDAHFNERSAPAGVVGDSGRSMTVRADRNGVAVVRPNSGETTGSVLVQIEALREDGGRIGSLGYHLIVLERQDAPTRLVGKVLDHSGTPLAGVRLSIGRTMLSVLSDEEGYFEFAGQVPPGKVDLFVDGRDVRFSRDGTIHEYPALHFETLVVQGQLNQLPHVIYLPPIDLGQAQIVGGDEEVILNLPGFDGFEMRVKPNSVTFPDGSRIGPLVVSPVHNDRLPMVPLASAGRFETVGWTIQPTNARFDPPIEVRIPNTSGLRPGQTLQIQQWDHDLALFVPMGNGTVSEDGVLIVSDPGSGITKAGWGGGPPPPPPNTGENQCSDTRSEQGRSSTLTVLIDGQDQEIEDPIGNRGNRYRFSASVNGECKKPRYTWNLGDGTVKSGNNFNHTYKQPGRIEVLASVECGCGASVAPVQRDVRLYCDLSSLSDTVKIKAERYVIKLNKGFENAPVKEFTSYVRPGPRAIQYESGLPDVCASHIRGGWSVDGVAQNQHKLSLPFATTNAGKVPIKYEINGCSDCKPESFSRDFFIHVCTLDRIQKVSADFLMDRPRSNREYGGVVDCREGQVTVVRQGLSPGDDYCKVQNDYEYGPASALPHTHPFFQTQSDVVGSHCQAIVSSANGNLTTANQHQKKVSDGDKQATRRIEGFGFVGWSVGCSKMTEGVRFWDPLSPGSSSDIRNRNTTPCH